MAFSGAGSSVGLSLWMVTGDTVVYEAASGSFSTAGVYILLSTQKSSSGLAHNIHLWHGLAASYDAIVKGAMLLNELQEALSGNPTQYREVETSESFLFVSYFKDTGLTYTSQEANYSEPRLLHVKAVPGKRIKELSMSSKYFNSQSSVFVLDAMTDIFIHAGMTAKKSDKQFALEVASKINQTIGGGKANIISMAEDPKNEKFWRHFKNETAQISPTLDYEDPSSANADASAARVFEIVSSTYASDAVEFSELDTRSGPLSGSALQTRSGYVVVSSGGQGCARVVYVWVGMNAPPELRVNAMAIGLYYIQATGLPANNALRVVHEAGPPKDFRAEFVDWIAQPLKEISDARSMLLVKNGHKDSLSAEELSNVDVAEGGSVKIWRVDGVKRVNLAKEKYGHFYSTDCYVLLYTFNVLRKDEYIIFYWMGAQSSSEDRETTVLLARFMEESLEGAPVLVRVLEGLEPAYLRRLFRGNMIVHSFIPDLKSPEKSSGGGIMSMFSRKTGASGHGGTLKAHAAGEAIAKMLDMSGGGGNSLYRVRGTSALTTIASRVPCEAASLNSVNCFVLDASANVFVRTGSKTTPDENTAAGEIGTLIGTAIKGMTVEKPVRKVAEGSEPEDFWKGVGGKGPYEAGTRAPVSAKPTRDAKLYLVSTTGGQLKFIPVDNFKQETLVDDEVFVLDACSEVVVWVGGQLSAQERDMALDFGVRFNGLMAQVDGRSVCTPIVKFQSSYEKYLFTRHFPNWTEDTSKADEFQKTVLKELISLNKKPVAAPAPSEQAAAAAVEAEEPASILPSAAKEAADAVEALPPPKPAKPPKPETKPAVATYEKKTLRPEELKEKVEGIDVMHKESYLDDLVFQEMFGMTRDDFNALPKWKQANKKKTVGLF